MIPALMPNYNRVDLAFERGEGAYLFSTDGRRFLDFASGIAVTALGHAHPHLVQAVTEQAAKLWHTSNIFRIPHQQRLAERLVEATFADTAFFCNSGAEAVECGIKMIRKHFAAAGTPERNRIVCATNAFHGRTLTTIFAAGQDKMTEGFAPAVPGFDHVAFNNLNELRDAVSDQTAGILVEPIQGEGGIRTPDPEYLRGVRKVADEYGLLLMYDEVQTGVGRTGRFFAYEWADAPPDIMAVAKGLGGGFPVGACLATERAAAAMGPGTHGSTFGGNPLAMAVANAVVDVVLEPGFLDRVREVADALRTKVGAVVDEHPSVLEEVRGQGLLLGVKCAEPHKNTDMLAHLRDEGLLAVGAGDNVVRLLPPLIIETTHVDEAAGMLSRAAAAAGKG